jgi:hypothetical protein
MSGITRILGGNRGSSSIMSGGRSIKSGKRENKIRFSLRKDIFVNKNIIVHASSKGILREKTLSVSGM